MVTRTSVPADYSSNSPFSLRAEVMLLLIITIFGLIGLSFCIGLYGHAEDISSNFSSSEKIQLVDKYAQQTET